MNARVSWHEARVTVALCKMAVALICNNVGQLVGLVATDTDLATPVPDFRSHYFSRSVDPSEAVVERFRKESGRAPVVRVAGSPVKVQGNIWYRRLLKTSCPVLF